MKITTVLLMFLFASCNSTKYYSTENTGKMGFTVKIKFDRTQANDSLELFIIDPFFGLREVDSTKCITSIKQDNGYFNFNIYTESDGYFQVVLLNNRERILKSHNVKQPLVPISYFEVGDNITIDIVPKKLSGIDTLLFHYNKWYDYSFSGVGSNKLKLMLNADSIKRNVGDSYSMPVFNDQMKFIDPNQQSSSAAFNYLRNHKQSLSKDAYWVLQADNVYSNSLSKFAAVQYYIQEELGLDKTGYIYEIPDTCHFSKKFITNYQCAIDTAFNCYDIPQSALEKSREYVKYLYYKVHIDCLVNFGTQNPDYIFNEIIRDYSGVIRDKLLTYFLVNNVDLTEKFGQNLSQALNIVKVPYCLQALEMIKKREFGQIAFNFTLPNEKGDSISLSDFCHKVVFIDFWYAGCGACAEFYESVLSKSEQHYKRDNRVKFVSICIDKKDRWMEFMKTGLYTSNLAINLNTNGRGYDANVIKHYGIVAYPSFLIIKDGIVKCFNLPEVRNSSKYLNNYIDSLLENDDS